MEIVFEKLERGITKVSQNTGKTYKVNTVHAQKILQDGGREPYTKDYFPNQEDIHMVFDNAKPGALIHLEFGPQKFKPLIKAEIIGAAAPGPAGEPSSAQASPAAKVKPAQFRDPDEIIRTDALGLAQQMVTTSMGYHEVFKGLLKKSSTLPSLMEEIIALADRYTKFIKGEFEVDPESSGDDVEEEEKDVTQPTIPE